MLGRMLGGSDTGLFPRKRDARPAGPLIWIHAPGGRPITQAEGAALEDLHRALLDADPGLTFAICTNAPLHLQVPVLQVKCPGETARDAQKFLQHWRPSLGIWLGPGDPNLVRVCSEQGIPTILVASDPEIVHHRLARASFPFFDHILAADEITAAALVTPTGKAPDVVGPLSSCPAPLKVNEAELEDIAGVLAGRPLWFAAYVPHAEIAAVLAAQRQAMQSAHRLLLLLMIDEEEDSDPSWRDGIRHLSERDVEGEPYDASEVFVIRGADELGLWLRLAPLTYLGGSLSTECAMNPMQAAALGSALIAGHRGGRWSDHLQRLETVEGLRRIGTAKALGRIVTTLMSADHAASLAHNAWTLSTEGAPLLNRLTELSLDAADRLPMGQAIRP
ncbi:glycosyltransferase N-terminal domain-containing protein [Actibacterium sp. 188UL27-1]|uniref:glycosyltransferase N-terminal domain-containing protein n=1 Tax=Actibacterium sp. 188UL27-1 TaxID=2786961 RepID=UPI00195D4071|nr:glycosyltransferase N-terminal domain-containing protein [Actibacterium sp. 188UL27-1]MBM7070145.1 hypothetical protein [Actibacterium sp. 188UL27-1]